MILARVAGTVVTDRSTDGIPGARYLLVEGCDGAGAGKKGYIIALDAVGAGQDEVVLVSQGTSSRQTADTDRKAVDALIIGIVDAVDEHGTITYRK